MPASFFGCVAMTRLHKASFIKREAIGICTNWKTVAIAKAGETLANTQAD
jgi:hypothetical protein